MNDSSTAKVSIMKKNLHARQTDAVEACWWSTNIGHFMIPFQRLTCCQIVLAVYVNSQHVKAAYDSKKSSSTN